MTSARRDRADPAEDLLERPGEHAIVTDDEVAEDPDIRDTIADNARATAAVIGAQEEIAREVGVAPKPRTSGVRAVLARLPMFDVASHAPDELAGLLTTLRRFSPKVDLREVLHAYDLAASAHAGQRRRSGEPYIIHPIGVAEVLAELGMDTPTIAAALLHDVIEDTSMTVADIAADFGEATATLVDGVTKLDRITVSSKEEQQAESLRKMLIAMANDLRVLLIKLADRLHNMRTIHHLPRDKQLRIADETLSIYAPLAHRLGMQNFKWQLEDLSFATLHPKRYEEIKTMVADRAPQREAFLEAVVEEVEERLRSVKLKAEVTGRPKHYYSIYEKMVLRGKEFTEIHDLVGIRVIVESVADCYAALGNLHAMWRPVPGRFKDYIAMPKFNLYQSLHTTVVGHEGRPIEVQIRTKAMHRTAEFGIAAHWKYKQVARGAAAADEAQWLTRMLDMQASETDSGEFMRNMKLDLYADEVFVFTPRGEIVSLPRGSTPVDFAYAVHTEVGHRTVGARINGRLVGLEYGLHNGEQVEILTSRSPDAGPKRDWLEFVGSSRARTRIRAWFSRERREDAIEKGRGELVSALTKLGLPRALLHGPELMRVAEQSNYADVDALLRAIGDSHASAQAVAQQVALERAGEEIDEEEVDALLTGHEMAPATRTSEGVRVAGLDDVWVTLARCCHPAPGDGILGFVTRGRGVSVHRVDCPNAEDLRSDPDRLVEVAWDASTPATFRVTMQVEALDRKHLLRDVTSVLGDVSVNILSAQVTTQRDRIAHLHFTFELADMAHLDHLLAQVRRVEGVYDAYRMVPRTARVDA